jgi:hypothetical protein
LSFNPTSHLALQVSTGRLASPEGMNPTVSLRRTTASVLQEQRLGVGRLSTTFAYGRNSPSAGEATDAWLLDGTFRWGGRHTAFARGERVAYDELPGIGNLAQPPIVRKGSVGYQYDFAQWGHVRVGIGGVMSQHWMPDVLTTIYGPSPESWTVYLRARLTP